MIDEGHLAAQRLLAHDLARLALGADEEDRPAVRRQLARELERVLVQLQGLFQVDDVDLVAVTEDVRRHLRVPVAGLMAEMDPRLQHLTHSYRHAELQYLGLMVCRTGRLHPGSQGSRGTLNAGREIWSKQMRRPARNSSIISAFPAISMSAVIKNQEEVERMRLAGRLAAEVLDYITPYVKPG